MEITVAVIWQNGHKAKFGTNDRELVQIGGKKFPELENHSPFYHKIGT